MRKILNHLIIAISILGTILISQYEVSAQNYKYESCIDPYIMVNWPLLRVENAEATGYGAVRVGIVQNPNIDGEFACVGQYVFMVIDIDDKTNKVEPYFIVSFMWKDKNGKWLIYIFDEKTSIYKFRKIEEDQSKQRI